MTETTTLERPGHVERLRFVSFDKEETMPPVAPPALAEKARTLAIEPLAPPPPVFTEKNLQAARSEAQAQGYREGFEAAEAKLNKEAALREDAIKAMLDVITNRITIAAESHIAYLKEQQSTMGKLVLAIARKLAGDALKREPYTGVESLLRECAGLIAGEPKIIIAVSPALSSSLRQRIDTLKPLLAGFEGELLVEEDAAISEQDCRVEWKNGYGERNDQALWNDIEAIIAKTTTIT